MMTEDKWRIIHDYRRLIRRGNVPVWRCGYCDGPVVIRANRKKDDAPEFTCFDCAVHTMPGTSTYIAMQELIDGKRKSEVFNI